MSCEDPLVCVRDGAVPRGDRAGVRDVFPGVGFFHNLQMRLALLYPYAFEGVLCSSVGYWRLVKSLKARVKCLKWLPYGVVIEVY